MCDLLMLNVELDHCKAQLRDLQAELHFVLDAKPVDTFALGDVASRTREVAARLEAVTSAILKGTSGPH